MVKLPLDLLREHGRDELVLLEQLHQPMLCLSDSDLAQIVLEELLVAVCEFVVQALLRVVLDGLHQTRDVEPATHTQEMMGHMLN